MSEIIICKCNVANCKYYVEDNVHFKKEWYDTYFLHNTPFTVRVIGEQPSYASMGMIDPSNFDWQSVLSQQPVYTNSGIKIETPQINRITGEYQVYDIPDVVHGYYEYGDSGSEYP